MTNYTFNKQTKLKENTRINLQQTTIKTKTIMKSLKVTVWSIWGRYINNLFYKKNNFTHHFTQLKKNSICHVKQKLFHKERLKTSFLILQRVKPRFYENIKTKNIFFSFYFLSLTVYEYKLVQQHSKFLFPFKITAMEKENGILRHMDFYHFSFLISYQTNKGNNVVECQAKLLTLTNLESIFL